MDIPEQYCNFFDFIIFTIGAITWFEDLNKLFQKVSDCLKPGGILFINDFHPAMNLLPLPGEAAFDKDELNQIAYSYFRKEPWIEDDAAGYMSGKYATSGTFTSFSHTMSDIVNAACKAQLNIVKLNVYDYDVGLSDAYDKKGFPLSYLLIAKK